MKYTTNQKAQIEAIKEPNRTFAHEYEKYVVITEGHIGYYIHKNELVIDISKLKPFTSSADMLNPEGLFDKTVPARMTRNIRLMPSGEYAILLKSDDERKAWINMKYLKQFTETVNVRITGEKEAVYLTDYKGNPRGIIMPMNVSTEDD